MSLNVKRLRRFIKLYEEYDEARRKWLLATFKAGESPCPEVAALEAEMKALIDKAVKQFSVSPHYFGIVGRNVKAMADSPEYW